MKYLQLLGYHSGHVVFFFFPLPDRRDLTRDLGNCVLCSPSCLLAGSAAGTQLTSGTLSPLSPHLSPLALTYLFGEEGKLKSSLGPPRSYPAWLLPTSPASPSPCFGCCSWPSCSSSHCSLARDRSRLSPDSSSLMTLPNVAPCEHSLPTLTALLHVPILLLSYHLSLSNTHVICSVYYLSLSLVRVPKACNKECLTHSEC